MGWYGTILSTTSGGVSNVKQNSSISSLTKRFILCGNYPNPFNAEMKIRFEILESRARVRLTIYNLQGHLVAELMDEESSAGLHEVIWRGTHDNGTACASGLYLYRLEVNGAKQVGKAILLK